MARRPLRQRRALLLLLLLLAALLLGAAWALQARRAGAVRLVPAPDAEAVSALTPISITFPEDVSLAETPSFSFTPAISGTGAWEGNTLRFRPARPLLPATSYSVTLSGLETVGGEQLAPRQWQFRTAPLQVLYIGWDEAQRPQIYQVAPDGGVPLALTDSKQGVEGYALSPDGTTIAYTARRGDGGSDLWAVTRDGQERRRLLACPEAACSHPAWHPDGQRLVYVRRALLPAEDEAVADQPRLWWLLAESGETVPLFADDNQRGTLPRFSASGRWLAYVAPGEQAIYAYDLESGASVLVPSGTGEAPVWHPEEPTLLTSEILFPGERFSVHLYRVSLPSANSIDLSGDLETNDSAPAWAPDGQQIAFTRKVPRAPIGKQIWLMAADGSEQRPLTRDPERNFSNPTWSPDATRLLVQQFAINETNAQPAIWLLDARSGEASVVAPGILPGWLP